VFKGEKGIPRDEDAIKIWKDTFAKSGIEVGVAGEDEIIKNNIRIIPLGTDDNFWIAGATGPCGGDTEMFYDTAPEAGKLGGKFSDLVASGRLIEIWNDVFMEFNKTADGKYEKLAKPNVDTGMGVARTLAVLDGKENVFETEIFQPILKKIEEISGKKYAEHEKSFRIITDHIEAATFMISDGITPLNIGRGYVLRRLIRRAVRHGKILGIESNFTQQIAEIVIKIYGDFYEELGINKDKIFAELEKEENKFRETLEKGLKEFNKAIASHLLTEGGDFLTTEAGERIITGKELPGEVVFNLYATFGFPLELTREIAKEKDINVDEKGFQEELQKHQELSRTASAGAFKGGLQSQDEQTAKLHTATHLLNAALREVLGPHVFQKGSNITLERLRFDFAHHEKMTSEQLEKVQNLVNEVIRENIPVECVEMSVEEAKAKGAQGVFDSKYGDKVKVYSAGEYSKEICGGPHASSTGELGHFKITKEEASSAGVRRIKAILE
jgi:alanyl-tRNA synthetase